MKHKYKAFFLPDHIDEQIDHHLEQQQDAGQPTSPSTEPISEKAAQQAVHVLQKQFAPSTDEAARLQRVWQRLEPKRAELEIQVTDIEKDMPTLITDTQTIRRKPLHSQPTRTSIPYQNTLPHFSRFSTLVAAACTIILIGGIIAGLQMLHQGKSQPSSAVSAKETASIYNFTEADGYYKLDPVTHNVLWHRSTPRSAQFLAAKNGLLYISDGGKTLYALNPSDGSIQWSTHLFTYADPRLSASAMSFGSPIVTKDMIYFALYSDEEGYSVVYALSATTGREVWQYRLDNTGIGIKGMSNSDAIPGITLQAATDDILYITKSLGPSSQPETTLYALDVKHQGQELWHKAIMPGNQPDFGGTVIDGVLCLSSSQKNNIPATIYGYDASTGIQKWSILVNGQVSHMVEANGVLYIGSAQVDLTQDHAIHFDKGYIYALRPQDGSALWHYTNQGRVSDPVIENGIAYFTSSLDNGDTHIPLTLTALDATTGLVRWSYTVTNSGGFNNAPIVASNDFLYLPLSNSSGVVKVFHIPDGKPTGSFSVPVITFDEVFFLTIVP
jgi:outer membrane protein assembly factor BamB